MSLGAPSAQGPRWVTPASIGLALGAVAGLALVVVSPAIVAAALVGMALYALSVAKIEVGLFCILLATSSVIDESRLPQLDLGAITLLAPDLVLIGLLAHAAWAALRGQWRPLVRPTSLLLLAFLALGALATGLGLATGGIEKEMAVGEARYLAYYALYFPLVVLCQGPSQSKRLMAVVWIVGALVGAAMLLQYTLGLEVALLGGRVEALSSSRSTLGVTRIIPPGESVVFISFLSLFVAGVVDPSRLRKISFYVLFFLSGVGVLLTFYRAFWLAIGLAMALFLVIASHEERRRVLVLGTAALVIAAMLITPFLLDPGSEVRTLALASIQRFLSVAGLTDVTQDESLRWRDPENEHVMAQLPRRLLLGLGFGARYRPYDARVDSPGFYDGRHFIHNGHLGIVVKAGGLAYLCYVALFLRHLWGGLWLSRRVQDPALRALWLGCGLSCAPLPAIAIAHPVPLYWFWIPVLATLFAIGEQVREHVSGLGENAA